MTPVIHCSAGNIHFFTRATFSQRKEIPFTGHNVSGNYARLTSSSQSFSLPQSLHLFQIYRGGFLSKHGSRVQSIAAVGAGVTVEETDPAVSGEDTDKTTETSTNSVETSESTPTNPVVTSSFKTKRSRPARKSEMPQVKDEDLTPGNSFTGKVRSIQPFGAFVDFGAFTDGLVHVSRMSDEYVKDVGSLVSVGQEVKVRIVEANMETGRISLTMRDNDDARKTPQRRESPASGSSDRPRSGRTGSARSSQKRDEEQKKSKFVKGQLLNGTVKNVIRSGSFVSLPDGEEGFIPVSEESEGYGNIPGNSTLQVGQEVNARVLRITRGKVTLTMKKEEDVQELNRQLNKGVWHAATNPFELAFRRNKDIASFLDGREKAQRSSDNINLPEDSEKIVDRVEDTITKSDIADGSATLEELLEETPPAESSFELVSGDEEPVGSLHQDVDSVLETLSEDTDSSKTFIGSSDSELAKTAVLSDVNDSSVAAGTGEQLNNISEQIESAGNLATGEDFVANKDKEKDSDSKSAEENEKDLHLEASIVDESTATDEIKETDVENVIVSEEKADSKALTFQENGDPADPTTGENLVGETDSQILSSQLPVQEEGDSFQADAAVAEGQLETVTPVVVENKAAISPAVVKQLREETGAGMMDCKKALSETGGDLIKAQEFLRKKGLASADKKASRATAEGRIGSYIHDGRIGILIEVNCETDFVSRGEIFKQLVDDLAMQVAASPQVCYLVTEDVPGEIVDKEREIEMQKEDLLSKPENIRSKIVDGRIRKRLEEFALLEQPYIKNDKMVVKDFVKQTIATIGENIKVARFVRYNLGEGLEKKSQDFAAEVASQTVVKELPSAPKDAPTETEETVEKPPGVAVSAALVKQLREETGAGMMDCKKALTETGGDLEKAQEYLRKKGLSSADKKSSRLAAEGRISSYIHDSRIGCLIEVNSETDFVARNEKFKELVDDLAMQVVACPQVEFVSVEDIPEDIVNKEKEMEMQRDDLKSKPDNIREKIVEGRISKRLGELALLEQPFIKDDKVLVKDLVKQTVAALGENIRVRRFVRFILGETKN